MNISPYIELPQYEPVITIIVVRPLWLNTIILIEFIVIFVLMAKIAWLIGERIDRRKQNGRKTNKHE